MKYIEHLTKRTALLLFLTISTYTFSQHGELTAKSFYDSIQRNQTQLLDVRTSNEYNQGHISGAFQADWNNFEQFKERVASLDKHKPLYVYCLAGSRSAAAQKWLLREGFDQVYNLRGGINAWNLEDLPVEGKKEVQQMNLSEFMVSIPKDRTVLVDIGAEWCPPCKKMLPVMNELEMEGYTIVKVNGGEQTQLVKDLRAEKFPTFIVFKNGNEVGRLIGICEKGDLKRIMD